MARFKENDLKSKLPSSLNKATLIFIQTITVGSFVGLVFLLLTGATALAPKLMGMLIDSVKKSYSDANNIALMLIGILLCNPFFLFRLSLFIDFTEHTLANLRHSI
jgi:hypothetical protein